MVLFGGLTIASAAGEMASPGGPSGLMVACCCSHRHAGCRLREYKITAFQVKHDSMANSQVP